MRPVRTFWQNRNKLHEGDTTKKKKAQKQLRRRDRSVVVGDGMLAGLSETCKQNEYDDAKCDDDDDADNNVEHLEKRIFICCSSKCPTHARNAYLFTVFMYSCINIYQSSLDAGT